MQIHTPHYTGPERRSLRRRLADALARRVIRNYPFSTHVRLAAGSIQ